MVNRAELQHMTSHFRAEAMSKANVTKSERGTSDNNEVFMFQKGIMKFGSKVKWKNTKDLHPDLRDVEFCLIGFDYNAFALIPWANRGAYFFDYYGGEAVVYVNMLVGFIFAHRSDQDTE